MSDEDRHAVSDNTSADGCLTSPRTLQSALALQDTRNTDKKSRRVTFPEDEARLVTGYLEPVTPWSTVDEITNEELITEYQKSCEKHLTQPIQAIVDQLRALGIADGVRRGRLSIKGFPLSAPACEALESIFKRVRFNRLDLRECRLTDETAVALFDMVEYYESAGELDISGNHEFGFLGWSACSRMIHKSQCLEQLKASETSLAENTAPALGRSLRNPCNLRCLHLQRSKLAGRPLLCLTGYLKQNKSVRELHLGDNELRAEDAQHLAGMLKGNSSLQLLDVSNNDIQDSGIELIAEALAEQSALNSPSSGSSSDSPMSSPQSASSGSVQERGLAVLIVWNNNLTRNSGQHFSKALTRCRSLEVLNVGQNPLGGETVNRIKGALQKNRSLLSLGMQSARLGAEAAVALAEVIEDNPVIQRIDLRDNRLQVAGLLALATALRNNRGVTRIDLDNAPSPPNGTPDDRHPIEETRLVAEIRAACKRNLDSPAAPLARKISLTCQTLQATRVPIPEILTPTHLSPPRSQSRPLRSPLPSPIPSPAGSPVPSPSKSSRFKVSRVVDNKEQKNNRFSIIRNVNLSSDCNRSDPEIFANVGGSRIDAELCVCCKSRSTDDLTRGLCQCRGVNSSKSDDNLCEKIPDGNTLRKSASVCGNTQDAIATHCDVKESALDSPDLEISRVMMRDFEESVVTQRPIPEVSNINKTDRCVFVKDEDEKFDNFTCDVGKSETRRSILSASSNESSMESSTFEAAPISQYSNQLNSSVSSNESVSPNMFGKHLKLHGSVTSLEASVSSVDSIKSANGNNVFNFNSDDKLPSESCHSNADSGFESKIVRNESISSNEETLTSGSNLRSNMFSSASVDSADIAESDRSKTVLLELPNNCSPKNTARSRKISWIAPYNPNPVPFHPKADVIENAVEPVKPPTSLEKLLSIFQHPGSLFVRNTESGSAEKKNADTALVSGARRDSQGSNSNSFWSWGLGGSSNSNAGPPKGVVPVVTATVDKLKRFGESFESTSSQETSLDTFYSSSVSAEYTLRLAEGRHNVEREVVNKDDVKKTVERIVQKDNLMDDDKSQSIDDLTAALTPSELCSELMERQIFNVPLEAVPEVVSISPHDDSSMKLLEEHIFDVELSTKAEHDSSPPLLERPIVADDNDVRSATDVAPRKYDERISLQQYGFGRSIEIVPQIIKDPNYVLERLAIADVLALDKKPIISTEIVLENRLAGGGSGVSPNHRIGQTFCENNIPFCPDRQTVVGDDEKIVSTECDIVFNPTLALGGSDLHKRFLIDQINLQNALDEAECNADTVSADVAEETDDLKDDCVGREPEDTLGLGDLANVAEHDTLTILQPECVHMHVLNVNNSNSNVAFVVNVENVTKDDVLVVNSDANERGVDSRSVLPVSYVKTDLAAHEAVCDNKNEDVSSGSQATAGFSLLPDDGERISSFVDNIISEAINICVQRLSIVDNGQDFSTNIDMLPGVSMNLVNVDDVCRDERTGTKVDTAKGPCVECTVTDLNICEGILEETENINADTGRRLQTEENREEMARIGEKMADLEASSCRGENSVSVRGHCDKIADVEDRGGCDIKNTAIVQIADIVQMEMASLNKDIILDLTQNAAIRPSDLQQKNKMHPSVLKQSIGLENKGPAGERQLSPDTGPSVDSLPSKIIRRIKENISPENTLTPSMSNTQTLAKELLENRSVVGIAAVLENQQHDEFIAKLFGKLDEDDERKGRDDVIGDGFIGKVGIEDDNVGDSAVFNFKMLPILDGKTNSSAIVADSSVKVGECVITEELMKCSIASSDTDKDAPRGLFRIDASNIEVLDAEEVQNNNNPVGLMTDGVVLTPTPVDQAKDALADILEEDGRVDNLNKIAIVVDECSPLATQDSVESLVGDVDTPIEIATAVDACTISDVCPEMDIARDVTLDDVFLPSVKPENDTPKCDVSGDDDSKIDVPFKPVSILKNRNSEANANTSSPKDIPDGIKKKPFPNYDRTHPIPSKKSSHESKNLPLRCGSLPETSSPRSLNPNMTPVGSRSPVGGTIGKLARDSLYGLNISDEELDRIRVGGQPSMESVASLGSVSEDVSQDDECEVSSSSSLVMSATMEAGDE